VKPTTAFVITLFVVAGAATAPRALAIEAAQASATSAASSIQPLKLTVVISRYDGEKKIGSLPFVLMVIPGTDRPGDGTTLQMGSEVPVPTTVVKDGQSVASYTYRSIGTNLTAAARVQDEGRYYFTLRVTDSQILSEAASTAADAMRGLPRFQSFTSTTGLLLRDGQTVQYTAATDKTSGEVVRIDVTLNVVK